MGGPPRKPPRGVKPVRRRSPRIVSNNAPAAKPTVASPNKHPKVVTGLQVEDAFAHLGVVTRTNRIGQVFDKYGVVGQVQALHEHYRGLKDGHRTALMELHVTAYYLADILRSNGPEWERFAAQPEWDGFDGQKPTVEEQPNSLKYVLRYMIGFGSKGRTESVSNSVAALEPPFKQRVPPESIRALIKDAGGLQKLAKLNRDKRREAIALEEQRERSTAAVFLHDKRGEAIFVAPVGTLVVVELEVLEPRNGEKSFKVVTVVDDGKAIPLES